MSVLPQAQKPLQMSSPLFHTNPVFEILAKPVKTINEVKQKEKKETRQGKPREIVQV